MHIPLYAACSGKKVYPLTRRKVVNLLRVWYDSLARHEHL